MLPVDGFLKAIEPFFMDGPIAYVDAGAHRGMVLQAILDRGLSLREALLIEPNPASFAALEERVTALELGERARCFNVALSDAPGLLRLRDADTMTKVVDAETEAATPGQVFEIEASTLDKIAQEMQRPHINLLKIDVEGFELQVLAGASGLLSEQAVDIIYIEAGLNSESTQQTYYRYIEDALALHGYRLFRIFEQKHEWIEDSPFLRRVNLAFMSARFAASHPYDLCRKLHAQRRANDHLRRAQAAAEEKVATLRIDYDALQAEHESAERRVSELKAANEALQGQLAVASTQHAAADKELRKRRAEVARTADLLEAERGERAALTERMSKRIAQEATRATEAAAQAANADARHDKLHRYARGLEQKLAFVLRTRSWRVTAPLRTALRLARSGKKPAPFVPKLKKPKPASRRKHPAKKVSAPVSDPAPDDRIEYRREVRRYVHHLWGGLSQPSVRELERVLADPRYEAVSRFHAANTLATWYVFDGNLDAALCAIRAIDSVAPAHRFSRERLIREGFIHLKLGDTSAARAAFERLIQQTSQSYDSDATLALANCLPDDDARVAQIGKVLTNAGHVGIERIDPARPLGLANIRGLPATCAISDLGKVSVIMPSFSSEDTIRMAIRSLQEQTYRNLEIIVVDDCSPDGTHAVAAELATSDSRIVALRQECNGGAYAARNRGLAVSTGVFVTTHDADDWSHPQKIERQLAYLSAKPDVMGVCTYWVRTTSDLQMTAGWRIGDRIIHWSHSSLLLRRQALERIGNWDQVRVGADTELIWRLQVAFGKHAFRMIEPRVPFAFALDDESSLTRMKQTHVRTIYYGLRQIYRAVAQHSHLRPDGTGPASGGRRIKVLPSLLSGIGKGPIALDFLLMGDCSTPEVVAQMAACVDDPAMRGKKVGVFHWPDLGAAPGLLCSAYADLLFDRGVIPVPPQVVVSLSAPCGIFFGDCTVEPDALPTVAVSTS